jgi:hypothetical protein
MEVHKRIGTYESLGILPLTLDALGHFSITTLQIGGHMAFYLMRPSLK